MNDRSPNAVGATAMNRRTLLRRAGLAAGTIAVGGAGALGYRAYDQGVFQLGQVPAYEAWADWKQHRGLLPLVAAATLAPNPYNSQPWLFRISSARIDLFADASRNIGAIDPFKRRSSSASVRRSRTSPSGRSDRLPSDRHLDAPMDIELALDETKVNTERPAKRIATCARAKMLVPPALFDRLRRRNTDIERRFGRGGIEDDIDAARGWESRLAHSLLPRLHAAFEECLGQRPKERLARSLAASQTSSVMRAPLCEECGCAINEGSAAGRGHLIDLDDDGEDEVLFFALVAPSVSSGSKDARSEPALMQSRRHMARLRGRAGGPRDPRHRRAQSRRGSARRRRWPARLVDVLIVSVAAQAGARHRSRDHDWASVLFPEPHRWLS